MKRLVLALFVLLGLAAQAQVTTISGDITSNTTWTADHVYELTGGFVYVTNNATLTIQPGTLIKGNQTALVITRGAKLMAAGTATQPIVFTSYQSVGQRAPGDWGGLLVLGKAPINDPAGERLGEGGIDPVKGLYGGTDPDDNSGTLTYVRIEYAGVAFQPNNETNGLTLGGVGRGTTVDHVQVSFGGDDSFEFFGGTVNAKHLISYRGVDDEFDTDYGYQGMLQFCVSLRDSSYADVSGSNGFESDNDATGSTNIPTTKPIISNFTIVGPMRTLSTSVHANYKRAAHLRRSTSECVYNSLLMGYPTGLKLDGQTTADNATSGSLQWKNNIIAGCTNSFDSTGLTGINVLGWFNANANSTLTNVSDLQLGNPYNWTAPNFQPQVGSPALTGADFGATNLSNNFFTTTTYRGAFDGTTDWTSGWANWDPQNSPYTSGITGVAAPVAGGNLMVHPNPANDATRLSFNMERGGEVSISVTTLSGVQVVQQSVKLNAGNNEVTLSTAELPAGLYIARIAGAAGVASVRLAVAR